MGTVTSWALLAPIYSGLVSLLLGFVVAKFKGYRENTEKSEKKLLTEIELLKKGNVLLIDGCICEISEKYKDTPSIPSHTLSRLDSLYKIYKGLGGTDGSVDQMYELLKRKPICTVAY